MKLLIVGTGAVGGYYGGLLAHAAHAVTFVARGEHGRAIREHGLVIETPEERLVVRSPVVTDVSEAAGMGADVALVAVKSASLEDVAEGVGAALGPGGVAIPLLNGLDSEDVLAKIIGPSRVLGGVAQVASRIAAPGHIRVEAPARMVIAPLSADQMPLAERLAAEFSMAGFGCDARRDLPRMLWTKLLWNAPFNAVCALTGKSAGEVLAIPELASLVEGAMQELARVAAAEGVTIDDKLILATLDVTRTKFSRSVPSMAHDVLAGRATEARALQGAVVVRGERHGIPTPIHGALLALVLGLGRPPPEARVWVPGHAPFAQTDTASTGRPSFSRDSHLVPSTKGGSR